MFFKIILEGGEFIDIPADGGGEALIYLVQDGLELGVIKPLLGDPGADSADQSRNEYKTDQDDRKLCGN